jgi:hypothetical protein
VSDRQDEQRPAPDGDSAAAWSAAPARRTDDQRWPAGLDMQVLRDHVVARCRAVIEIPYDSHLVTGGLIDLDRVAGPTRRAYLELAAAVADGFALPPLQRKPVAQA